MASKTQHSYTIRQITKPSDLTAWTQAQFDAFVNTGNVLHDTLFPPATPPTPAQVSTAADRHRAALTADPEHTVFIQITDPATDEIAGGAKWGLYDADPRRPAHAEVDWVDDSTPEGKHEKAFAQKCMDVFHGCRSEHMACPHALLDICYTTPKYERKGIASALVRWGLERADKEGWVAFTEASPRGKSVYERLGFENREEVRLRWDANEVEKGKGDVVWTFMERHGKTRTEAQSLADIMKAGRNSRD